MVLLFQAVTITGLGTFCVVEEQLDVGDGQVRTVRKPVFQLAETVTRISYLQYPPVALPGKRREETLGTVLAVLGSDRLRRPFACSPGDTPVVSLDYDHLSQETIHTPGVLRTCITETLLFFYCFVMTQQDIDFMFKDIGMLSVRNNRATMRFYADFLESFDDTGAVINSLLGVSVSLCKNDVQATSPAAAPAPLLGRTSFPGHSQLAAAGQRRAKGCLSLLDMLQLQPSASWPRAGAHWWASPPWFVRLLQDPETKELVIFGREKDVCHNSSGGVIVLPT